MCFSWEALGETTNELQIDDICHPPGTECSVDIHLEDNEINSLLGHNLENYQEHIEQSDVDYFHMWNYVQVSWPQNPCSPLKTTTEPNQQGRAFGLRKKNLLRHFVLLFLL